MATADVEARDRNPTQGALSWMAERQLTTRDLADTSDTDVRDTQGKSDQRAPDRGVPGKPTDNTGGLGENATTDEPLARDRSAEAASSLDVGGPLLPVDQSERFTTRWQQIQASFVDQPRDSVEQADALVADLMQRLAASFSDERERLEGQWDSGDDVSTEDLRIALTRYRSFFDRLLSA
jgi:hypothetical protein